ncbi:hypothetical protein O181_095807 [Austropuccinia psidii MF-1]|uniref:Uncharacterized protein n=1 Tax=Austropuccinia psidii MF-1 TaxID=1389203 RepID=A0A9Q3J5I7_9BASI|nr:hypothetical protein [Austropuccinia psidii MF-1]
MSCIWPKTQKWPNTSKDTLTPLKTSKTKFHQYPPGLISEDSWASSTTNDQNAIYGVIHHYASFFRSNPMAAISSGYFNFPSGHPVTSSRGFIKAQGQVSKPQIPMTPSRKEVEEDEGEESVEEEDSGENEVADALANAPEEPQGFNLASTNQYLVSQSDPSLLNLMEKMATIMGQLSQAAASRDISKTPSFKTPS